MTPPASIHIFHINFFKVCEVSNCAGVEERMLWAQGNRDGGAGMDVPSPFCCPFLWAGSLQAWDWDAALMSLRTSYTFTARFAFFSPFLEV